MSCIKEKSKYAFERAKQFYFMLWCKESLIYLVFSVLVTWCCGYTVKNALGECAYIVPDDVVGAAECYFSNVCLYLSFVKCILCSGWDDLRKNKQQFYCVCNADKYK